MKRRDFSLQLVAAGLGAAWAGTAAAQGQPVEGTHYTKLAQPVAVSAPAGKIEVIEFFSYGCPHCFALEPTLESWAKRLPPDVVFKRVPVGFNALYENYQKIYYALEAMGQLDAMHRKVFNAIHQQRLRLDKEADIAAFMNANGIDGAKFIEHFKSFSVQTKARQAQQLMQAYKIDGVPAMGVQGRYVTSGSLAGSNERALAVTDALVQNLRKPS
ncbi:MAG TPA: thiol:disulfide interchange protein DsbA/DsbL [Rubrivivax sp.]|nr:thiol:disulfide interchange protein DsbA/DsbL [Rubrivivax sp.]